MKENEWVSRLYNEHKELELKFKKLDEFVFSEPFLKLCDIDKSLLMAQHALMSSYVSILEQRIERALPK